MPRLRSTTIGAMIVMAPIVVEGQESFAVRRAVVLVRTVGPDSVALPGVNVAISRSDVGAILVGRTDATLLCAPNTCRRFDWSIAGTRRSPAWARRTRFTYRSSPELTGTGRSAASLPTLRLRAVPDNDVAGLTRIRAIKQMQFAVPVPCPSFPQNPCSPLIRPDRAETKQPNRQ